MKTINIKKDNYYLEQLMDEIVAQKAMDITCEYLLGDEKSVTLILQDVTKEDILRAIVENHVPRLIPVEEPKSEIEILQEEVINLQLMIVDLTYNNLIGGM